ncbi:MAG: sulfotransferase family protein [Bauldia sp.]|nr:sulfotransferase family protein [Bauldia sp.]
MTLSVIGAGLGRTGTMSLKLALEQLGFGPCFHMAEFFTSEDADALKEKWERVAFATPPPDWDDVFAGYRSTVDFPSCAYWRELAAYYPEAKVILSVRDAERWYASTQETIFKRDPERPLPERTDPWGRMVYRIITQNTFGGDTASHDHCIAVYNRHNAAVEAALPKERLLVYEAGSGWEPICGFLGVPVPETPFPRENTTEAFQAKVAERKAEAARAAAAGEAG